jgi:hypothetical protein
MNIFIIDPYNQAIAERQIPGQKTSAMNSIRHIMGTFCFRPQPGLEGYNLLLINPDEIYHYDSAAFRYQENLYAFGAAIIIGYDPYNDCLVDPTVNMETLQRNIQFLSVEDSNAIGSDIRLGVAESSIFQTRPFIRGGKLYKGQESIFEELVNPRDN